MDANNFCGVCEEFKPCLCDIKSHKFDTSEYINIPKDASFYEVIGLLKYGKDSTNN